MKTWFLIIATFLLISANISVQAQIARRLSNQSFAHIPGENKDAFTIDAYIGDDQELHIRITGAGKEEVLLNIYNTKGKVIAHHKLNIAGNHFVDMLFLPENGKGLMFVSSLLYRTLFLKHFQEVG